MDLEHHGQIIVRDPEEPHDSPTGEGCCCARAACFVPRAWGLQWQPGAKPFSATRAAKEHFTDAVLRDAVLGLAAEAERTGHGLCFQQVYHDSQTGRALWIMEDAEGITALLPEEY